MGKITKEELNKIIYLHRQWLENKETGERADLSNTDLRCVSLIGVNLSHANLSYSNLHGSSLSGATLTGADLSHTDLRRVNLSHVNLEGSDLTCADLWGSDLTGANLTDVNLYCANLTDVNLSHADLTGANLYYATLKGVQNIYMAITDEETKFFNNQYPKKGEFIGWNKCHSILSSNSGCEYIVKLLIPSDAKRSSATTKKCRCSKAKVLAIYDTEGKEITDKDFEVYLQHDRKFKYKVGQTVTPNRFDKDWWNEWSNGIHFFIERERAEEY